MSISVQAATDVSGLYAVGLSFKIDDMIYMD